MPRSRAKDSEVHAYQFINEQLKLLNWDVRDPERSDGGQVWTQNECLSNPGIKECLALSRPENIVRVTEDVLWGIEAKRSHGQLEQALREAEEYARDLKRGNRFTPKFISGVAGNEIDSFLVRTRFFDGRGILSPVTINGVEATGLLGRSELLSILESGRPDIAEPSIDDRLFISRAEHINRILHLGAVNPHQRAGVMAALLLSMLGDTSPNIDERRPTVLVGDINARVQSILRDQGKSEFYDYIRINLPSTTDNHVKLRRALVDTLQELNNLNIRSAMNSGADWLGVFYEIFLKYASWAQDLGIVLTPRHLTRWVADVMDIKVNDILYDPTCGTGGFLVAGFDHVKQNSNPTQLGRFKQHSVFGVEQDAGVAALAVVNMIFRGDGKNNIQEGNCFSKHLTATTVQDIPSARYVSTPVDTTAVTKVMMNPPFSLKRSDEKEFRFINQALAQMETGGILFSVLPYSVMVKPGAYATWRKEELLPNHTLLSVVTLPMDVFYPVEVTTVGVFIRKGFPHPKTQNVLWVRALTDGLLKSKGKRLPRYGVSNDLEYTRDLIKSFVNNPSLAVPSKDQFQRALPVDFTDRDLELVPEVYLNQALPSKRGIEQGLNDSIRKSLAYLIKIDRASIQEVKGSSSVKELPPPHNKWGYFNVEDVFHLQRGHFHSIADLDSGDFVTISRSGNDNGFVGFYDKPEGAGEFPAKTITISTVTGDAFAQPVPFIATDNVVMLSPKPAYSEFDAASLMFVAQMLNEVKWRFSYGRQCYKGKFSKTNIPLPTTEAGTLDYSYMKSEVEAVSYWPYVKAVFEN